jgi:hypothetical protein
MIEIMKYLRAATAMRICKPFALSVSLKALIHSVKIDTVEVAASVATAMGILKPGST